MLAELMLLEDPVESGARDFQFFDAKSDLSVVSLERFLREDPLYELEVPTQSMEADIVTDVIVKEACGQWCLTRLA